MLSERPVSTPPAAPAVSSPAEAPLAALDAIQRRVLWLATAMIHHANNIRPNPDGTKVGGHQASSASLVTLMTALYAHFLQPGDRVAVKPHASPVLHALQYLLGRLPRDYMTTLRQYGGLQAYPSRTKDPIPVDFSTGSVGLGAVAPAFAALAETYIAAHFPDAPGARPDRRYIAIVGDAELDEGNVWEAVLEPALDGLGRLLWIVDLNRQSLDRVVPGIRAAQLKALFEQSGWHVLEAKYGRRLEAIFSRPGGDALRQTIDDMPNETYQALIRLPAAAMRDALVDTTPALADLLADVPDADLPGLISNLGGHDLATLIERLHQVDDAPDRPTVLFAYTIKGWGLPIAGHPLNHSMLLTQAQIDALRAELDIPADDDWPRFTADSAPGAVLAAAAERLYGAPEPAPVWVPADAIPDEIAVPAGGAVSTQQTFGRVLMALSREEALVDALVTASPDVAVSTNLSGWINKAGVFARQAGPETPSADGAAWRQGPDGRHIELGISEMNLFLLLGAFGLSAELAGRQLIPIGTVYDPFVLRGLDAFIYALYSGARFIVAGTPSGITLAPEGGAHQSTATSSLAIELPNLDAFEPCYAQEMAWLMTEALRNCADPLNGRATYFRLSTRPVDQAPFAAAADRLGRDRLRQQVVAGGYRLRDWRAAEGLDKVYLVHLATAGALVPEALRAAEMLAEEGIPANVINLTSPRRLYAAWRGMRWGRSRGLFAAEADPFAWLIPPNERHAPLVTINDGASHAFAWLGSVFGVPTVPLGVDAFGQSGARDDLYRHYGIGPDAIVDAALTALNRVGLP